MIGDKKKTVLSYHLSLITYHRRYHIPRVCSGGDDGEDVIFLRDHHINDGDSFVRESGCEMLDSTGTVVGAFPISRYEEKTVMLEPGDLLLAYTDGITEPENVYGEMFGEDRLKDLVVKYSRADSAELIARTMEAVKQWTGAGELQDDMTMVVARRI